MPADFRSPSVCPVCGTATVRSGDRIEGTVCEDYEDCPNGCYHYAFSYGSTLVTICGREFSGHHTDSPEVFRCRLQQQREHIAVCRATQGRSQ